MSYSIWYSDIGGVAIERKILLQNMDKIHTTKMGIDRIKRNLNIKEDVVEFCKRIIKNSCTIYKKGKNYYVEGNNIRITINSYSYTIITAHFTKKGEYYGI